MRGYGRQDRLHSVFYKGFNAEILRYSFFFSPSTLNLRLESVVMKP